jgi:hypothetical protein
MSMRALCPKETQEQRKVHTLNVRRAEITTSSRQSMMYRNPL